MPTTRQQAADTGSDILHGLVEEKRVRKPGPAASGRKPGPKKGAKKGRGNLDPNLPHIALANLLYERGNDTQFPEQPAQSNPQQEPRTWNVATPITDPFQLPEGWSANEPDLDQSDTDAQIARCKKRIAEGIMPQVFENRLREFSKIKEQEMAIVKSEPNGLSWEVVQRLDCLKGIQESLEQEDPNSNLPNVKAILAAYRAQQLTWNESLVTYWFNGDLIAGPRKWDMQEFYGLSAKHGPKGFWVEGVDSHKPTPMNLFFAARVSHRSMAVHNVSIALRNPVTASISTMAMTIQCDFLLDTGATMMSVLPRDITEIQTLSGNLVPSLGSCRVQTAGGIVSNPSVVLQAMVFARGQPVLPSWVDVRAIVNSSSGGLGRLSGVWLFNLLFVLSMPDNHRNLFIGSDVGEMLASLPIPDYRNAIPAPIYM